MAKMYKCPRCACEFEGRQLNCPSCHAPIKYMTREEAEKSLSARKEEVAPKQHSLNRGALIRYNLFGFLCSLGAVCFAFVSFFVPLFYLNEKIEGSEVTLLKVWNDFLYLTTSGVADAAMVARYITIFVIAIFSLTGIIMAGITFIVKLVFLCSNKVPYHLSRQGYVGRDPLGPVSGSFTFLLLSVAFYIYGVVVKNSGNVELQSVVNPVIVDFTWQFYVLCGVAGLMLILWICKTVAKVQVANSLKDYR